jgi:hypothetical protein
MPGRTFEIIYPNGDFEIDASGQHPPPTVDDTIRRQGKLWRVTATTDEKPVIVRVELDERRARDVAG